MLRPKNQRVFSFGSDSKESAFNAGVKSLSRIRLLATPWTVTYQAPPSMGFSRKECWSGLPFPLQGIFPTQELNPGVPHCRQTLYRLSHQGSLNARDLGSIPGLERSPGGGHGNPLQCTCLDNPHGQRSLVGYSPWGCKELDMTKQLITQYIGTDRLPSPCQLTSTVSLSTWFAGSCLEKYP